MERRRSVGKALTFSVILCALLNKKRCHLLSLPALGNIQRCMSPHICSINVCTVGDQEPGRLNILVHHYGVVKSGKTCPIPPIGIQSVLD